jgi:hypothetical protein
LAAKSCGGARVPLPPAKSVVFAGCAGGRAFGARAGDVRGPPVNCGTF